MRKVYVVIGEHLGSNYNCWIAGVWSSYKKANHALNVLKTSRPENNYLIKTEIIL